jgi:hypothetical protein
MIEGLNFNTKDLGVLYFVALPVYCILRNSFQKRTISDPDREYDFVIVGGKTCCPIQVVNLLIYSNFQGGSAGCALASRLSEDPSVKVLLIEAGGDGLDLKARIPAAAGELQHSALDWNDFAEAQPGRACLKLIDGKSFWPRGKCLGKLSGCTLSRIKIISCRWVIGFELHGICSRSSRRL